MGFFMGLQFKLRLYLCGAKLQILKALDRASEIIKTGGLVAFPTETVYGLGANALDAFAVAKIFEAKERPSFDPLIVHISDLGQLKEIADASDVRIQELVQRLWPGPLTLILPKKDTVPDLVTSGLPTVGVRMPNHPLALELIRKSGCPIAAPSANKFGHLSPTLAKHVRQNLPQVEMVIDGGPTQFGLESTIVRLADDGFQILRPGGITREELLEMLPESNVLPAIGNPLAPGMMHSHYSPRKPLYIMEPGKIPQGDISKMGFIGFKQGSTLPFLCSRILAPNGDLKKYAAQIFEVLHDMEGQAEIEAIVAEGVPEEGLGIAIMDRLRKAAYNYRSS
jgi:L-threonylcarbamoyladenylate synthase